MNTMARRYASSSSDDEPVISSYSLRSTTGGILKREQIKDEFRFKEARQFLLTHLQKMLMGGLNSLGRLVVFHHKHCSIPENLQ